MENSLRDAILNDSKWTTTENGAEVLGTTLNACLDMFARAGAMRSASVSDKELMFSRAFAEDKDIAMKLLFFLRDVRGGQKERDTFIDMFRYLAVIQPESAKKNLWAIMEFGRAKDLFGLIDTPIENDMWEFVKNQFAIDCENMEAGKSISLLAKWIPTPDSASSSTKELGKLVAKKLGYNFKQMSAYKKKLRALRAYLDLPEIKMASGKWDEIEYSKCASRFILKHRKAINTRDAENYAKFLESVKKGDAVMHMGTNTPVDILHSATIKYSPDIEVMWDSLGTICEHNVMVLCDTSASMSNEEYKSGGVYPLDVAAALSIYFAKRNVGSLKDLCLVFAGNPYFLQLNGSTLMDNYRIIKGQGYKNNSTDMEAAFDKLLNVCVKGNVSQKDMPKAILVISDMQINCVHGIGRDMNLTFYDKMAKKYADAGYEMPQVVFWNVNASKASFLATKDSKGVSLVSGYSQDVFGQVMKNLGTTPLDLMLAVANSDRYKDITA